MKHFVFRNLTTLTFLLLIFACAVAIVCPIGADALHQVRITDDAVKKTPDHLRRVHDHDHPAEPSDEERARRFSRSHSIPLRTTPAEAAAAIAKAAARTEPTVGFVDGIHFDHIDHEEVNKAIVDDETGYGVHRRLIHNEGDTEEHRANVEGTRDAIKKKAEEEGDPSPIPLEAFIPEGLVGHVMTDAAHHGPMGAKAIRKIRQHLIAKGVIDEDDANAKLHIPHDLHLSEEDYYNDDEDEDDDAPYEDTEDDVLGNPQQANNDQQQNAGIDAPTIVTYADSGEEVKRPNPAVVPQSASKSLSPSMSARAFKHKTGVSGSTSASSSAKRKSASHRISASRKRPKHVTKALRIAGADIHGDQPTAEELRQNIHVANLNDPSSNPAAAIATEPRKYNMQNIHQHEALQDTRRERVKAMLRERKQFYAVQQPKSSLSVIDPAEWERFTCRVCVALTAEFADGVSKRSIATHPHRLIHQAETNVTDFYTWAAGRRDTRADAPRNSAGYSRFATRGEFTRTRADNRWDHKPHTPEESEIRTTVLALLHNFMVTLYDKEVFFPAVQQMAVSQRPVGVPAHFLEEEFCAIRKEVCPRNHAMYEGGRFTHLINLLNEAVGQRERNVYATQYSELHKQLLEERELLQEIAVEDEEDRIADIEAKLFEDDDDDNDDKKASSSSSSSSSSTRKRRIFSRSLGAVGDVDEHGNKVVIEGASVIKSRRARGLSNNLGDAEGMMREHELMEVAMRHELEAAEEERRMREAELSASHEL